MMDAALVVLPSRSGRFRRGQWLAGCGARREAFVRAHSHRGRVVHWSGYTSVIGGAPYRGDIKLVIWSEHTRELGPFSRAEPELLLPRADVCRS
jgi:hypothetical protein